MQRKTTLGKTARILAVLLLALMVALPAGAGAAPPPSPLAAPDAPQTGTISGTVFRDYNADGTRQTNQLVAPYLLEPGLSGVIITAYDVNNAVAGSTTSGATGAYSFTATGASGFRVEFTLPTDGSLDFLQAGAAGPTTVVFVPTGGQTGVNVGFNNPIDFSQVNPDLITPQTAFGPRSGLPAFVPGSASEQPNESIIGIGYNANGDLADTNQHDTYATLTQTGTLYGMIYQRRVEADPGRHLLQVLYRHWADPGQRMAAECGSAGRDLRCAGPGRHAEPQHQPGEGLRQPEQDHRPGHRLAGPEQPGRRGPAAHRHHQLQLRHLGRLRWPGHGRRAIGRSELLAA